MFFMSNRRFVSEGFVPATDLLYDALRRTASRGLVLNGSSFRVGDLKCSVACSQSCFLVEMSTLFSRQLVFTCSRRSRGRRIRLNLHCSVKRCPRAAAFPGLSVTALMFCCTVLLIYWCFCPSLPWRSLRWLRKQGRRPIDLSPSSERTCVAIWRGRLSNSEDHKRTPPFRAGRTNAGFRQLSGCGYVS